MSRRYRAIKDETVVMNILKLLFFILLSFGAIRLGIMGGDALSSVDSRQLIERVDAEHFKAILNASMPIINTTYNSGNISVSISGEIRAVIRNIFGFDLTMPVSILTAQSPSFMSYYRGSYQQLIAMRDLPDPGNIPGFEGSEGYTGDEGSFGGQDSSGSEKAGRDDNKTEGKDNFEGESNSDGNEAGNSGFLEAASSISMEEEQERKDITNADKVTTGKIEILNETKYKIDTDMINACLKEPLSFKFDRKGPKVLIFHTHATEGFIRSLDELNDKSVSAWTRDTRNNIVRVGAELAYYLEKKYGIDVIHNGTEHDYPDYNSSYKNAYKTLSSILPGNPSIKVALDIHRDAMANGKLRVTQVIDGKTCAQVMIVVAAGHPNWRENFKFAVKIQEKLNKYAPGLARPIYISKYTYNQNMTPGSLTIEIGGNGNMLSECLESTKYLAMALSEVLNNEAK